MMPLSRLKDEYLVQDGVQFVMTNEDGSSVACRVSHEALRDQAGRLQLAGPDGGHCHVNRKFAGQMTMAATVHAATVAWRHVSIA